MELPEREQDNEDEDVFGVPRQAGEPTPADEEIETGAPPEAEKLAWSQRLRKWVTR